MLQAGMYQLFERSTRNVKDHFIRDDKSLTYHSSPHTPDGSANTLNAV